MKNANYIIVVYSRDLSRQRCSRLRGFIFLTAAAVCLAALKVYETERAEQKNG